MRSSSISTKALSHRVRISCVTSNGERGAGMLPGFIESLIKRWSPSRTQHSRDHETFQTDPSANFQDAAVDDDLIQRVTTFWHDAISFVPLDDLIQKNPNAPEVTLDQAVTGVVTRAQLAG